MNNLVQERLIGAMVALRAARSLWAEPSLPAVNTAMHRVLAQFNGEATFALGHSLLQHSGWNVVPHRVLRLAHSL